MPASTTALPAPLKSRQAPGEGWGAGVPWGCASSPAPQERAPTSREKPANMTLQQRWLGHAWHPRKPTAWHLPQVWERDRRDIRRRWANPGGTDMGSRASRRRVGWCLEQGLNG